VNSEGKIHTVFFQAEHGEQPGKSHACSTIFVELDTFLEKESESKTHMATYLKFTCT
jgi:hypothetical protein